MRILTLTKGVYGERITANIRRAAVPGWTVETWPLPPVLPQVIDYPEEFLPDSLPAADLVLAMGEDAGVAELLPDIVQMCGARAVILPIDHVAWLPPGLMRQLARWLADLGVEAVFPKPFCSLTETTYNAYRRAQTYDAPLIAQFARRFGKPALNVVVNAGGDTVIEVEVVRDSPCGCARHVAQGLRGLCVDEAEAEAGMLHHHFPCLAGMLIDPEYSDTLMHVSGHLLMDEVGRGVKPYKRVPVYLRPAGRSDE